jgi:hypothetical protein
MGERAREAAARGPVLCVVTGSANVVRFLAHGTQTRVLEFWDRPFDPREAESAGPAVTVLVERSPRFRGWTPAGFAEGDRPDERYAEFVRGPSPP